MLIIFIVHYYCPYYAIASRYMLLHYYYYMPCHYDRSICHYMPYYYCCHCYAIIITPLHYILLHDVCLYYIMLSESYYDMATVIPSIDPYTPIYIFRLWSIILLYRSIMSDVYYTYYIRVIHIIRARKEHMSSILLYYIWYMLYKRSTFHHIIQQTIVFIMLLL